MKKYTDYNRHDLRKKIKQLEDLKLNKNLSESKLEEIDQEIYLLDNLLQGNLVENYFEIEKNQKLIDIMNDNYQFISTIKEYYPLYENYKENLKKTMLENSINEKTDLIYEDLPHDTSYTNRRIIKTVKDFYDSLPDKEIRDIFNKEFKDHRNNIRFVADDSGTSTTNYSEYKYISVSNENNFEKITELSHEYGHLIHDNLLNRVVFYDENYPLIELFSQFMEYLTMDYMNKGNNTKRATLLLLNKTLDMYNALYCNESYIETMNKGFNTSKEIRNYYLQNYGRTCLNYTYLSKAEQNHTYLISKIIIIELLNMYEKDSEKALYTLKELCKLQNCNYLKELEDRKIYLGENTENFIKKLSKNIDNSFNIKSNH